MKYVQADSLDSLASYRLIDGDTPSAGPGEVLIEVAACGVGYVDALAAIGGYQVKPPLPYTPGGEVAGRVRSVGDGVAGFAVNDRVMAFVQGGFAEYVSAKAPAVTKIPDIMSFAQAAGFRVNYLTALHGLRGRAAIQPGERLLVLGAAGGVGTAALQVGRILGAHVIAATSTEEKRAFALSQGADRVVDTDADRWRDRLKAACDGKGPDVVFDPVCGPLFEPAFRSLAWNGRHLVVGFLDKAIPALPANLTLMKGAALVGVDVRQFLQYEASNAAASLIELLSWVEDGRLDPPVGRTFPLPEFRSALEFALAGRGIGKTVLEIGQADDHATGKLANQ